MATPRILTFNFHEPYLCLMAKTGLPFDVGLYEKPPLARAWQTRFRPAPANLAFVEEARWRADLEAGRYDVVIAHNEMNAADLFAYKTPALLVCHNRRSFLKTTVAGGPKEVAAYDALLERLHDRFRFVFISESKRADYGLSGDVILPGIDVEEYGGYTGHTAEVLRVGNAMRARNRMFDVDLQEATCAGLPNRVVGEDPQIPEARPSTSFDDLLSQFRSLRCLLHVAREDWEDGYNLSMLEAMACGMPVVALANRTSPLTDGRDGLIGTDAASLRAHLLSLLDDPDRARELGARGRETVARAFPIAAFVEKWREAIERTADRGRRRRAPRPSRLNILMEYVASPITTARYLETALRKSHEVVTAGLRCPEAVLKGWGFSEPIPPYAPHRIDVSLGARYAEILAEARGIAQPQLYLWVDSGAKQVADDIDLLAMPKVCYLIDTHVDLPTRLEIARRFDFVFMAQKAQLPAFRAAGMRAHWLPLACATELHDVPPRERTLDVAYVGSLSDADDRRRRIMDGVRARFPNCRIGRAWPHEMAETYAQAKIVVNACVNRDVNMRVFEAMAAGALLITDEADGLEDLFEDGKHLVIYRNDEDVFALVERYLADTDARERIAAAGAAEVRANHTYDRRMEAMVAAVLDACETSDGRFGRGGYYGSPRPELMAQVPEAARRILDVGCGAGEFGRALKARGAEEVAGIEIVEGAWRRAQENLDCALLGNIEDMDLPFEENYFDCICCGDVLEHLVDPAAALRKLSRVLAPNGCIVMSIPNVRFCQVVQMLAHGRWTYEDAGILDRTHLRFFTAPEMLGLVRAAGLDPVRLQPLSMLTPQLLPREPDGTLRMGRMTMHDVSDEEYRDFLTYQYVVVAEKPGARRLEEAQRALDAGENEKAYGLAETATSGDGFVRARVMAKALGRLGKLDAAERLYREALAVRDDVRVASELGLVLVAMRRYPEAQPLLARAAAADADDDRAPAGLGLIDLAEGRPAEAVERFKTALDRNFDNAAALGHLLETARELGRLEEAEPFLRRYVEFYPGNADMACRYVELLQGLGRHADARERLETLLFLFPDHPGAQALHAALQGET